MILLGVTEHIYSFWNVEEKQETEIFCFWKKNYTNSWNLRTSTSIIYNIVKDIDKRKEFKKYSKEGFLKWYFKNNFMQKVKIARQTLLKKDIYNLIKSHDAVDKFDVYVRRTSWRRVWVGRKIDMQSCVFEFTEYQPQTAHVFVGP